MMVTITYDDGISFEAELNGTTYITDSNPYFPEGRFNARITGERYAAAVYNVEPVELPSPDGRYWFFFLPYSQEAARQKEMEDTIQMLTDCLLEMSERLYS